MKILVTGASGFIGTNLVNKLIKKHKVVCFVRNSKKLKGIPLDKVEIKTGDVNNKESIAKAIDKVDTVVHLAAITSEVSSDMDISRKVNVEGTRNLLEVCKEKGVKRFIHLTSESTKRKIKGAYAQTKFEADELIKEFGVKYTILRPSIVYGQGARGLFKKTLDYIEGLPVVPIIGSGKQKLIPIHIDDVTNATIAAIESTKAENKVYDLTGADQLTFNTFIEQILDELGIKKRKLHIPFFMIYSAVWVLSIFIKNPPVTKDNLLGLKQEVEMSYKDAEKDLDFKPYTFREGLRKSFYGNYDPSKKNIGIVGLGKMGLLHASILNNMEESNLVAVCDKNPKAAKQLRGLGIDVAFFTSVDRMINKMKLDGVFICTPPSLNFDISKKFIFKDISVFVEKPMANNLENAKKMLDYTKNKDITLSVGYMYAYHPIFYKLRKVIEKGEFGKPKSFDSYCYISQVFNKKSAKGVWHYNPELTGGGVLMTMASHMIFLFQWYFGELSDVESTARSIYTQMDDEIDAKLKFESKVEGKLRTSWSAKGYENLTLGITIKFEKAIITATNNEIIVKNKNNELIKKIHVSNLKEDIDFELGGKGYYAEDLDFIKSIGTKKKTITAWEKAYKAQSMIDMIYKNSKIE